MNAGTVRFTVVGWTDTGSGWQRQQLANAEVSPRYWAAATALSQAITQPPESVQDLIGVPVWSLRRIRLDGDQPMWCFTVQTRGANDRAGTTQFAFADATLAATTVWQAAAAAIRGNTRLPDRLPWVAADGTAAPPPGGDESWRSAASVLLSTLAGPPRSAVVPVGPEVMAGLVPAVLSVLPAEAAGRCQWHTCLLQPPTSARIAAPMILGEWSAQMRGRAPRAAAELDRWLDIVLKDRVHGPAADDDRQTIDAVATGLARGTQVEPGLADLVTSVREGLDDVLRYWQKQDIDVPAQAATGNWAMLRRRTDAVERFAADDPHGAVTLLRTELDPQVSEAAFRGLWHRLPADDDVLDLLGFPPAPPMASPAAVWQTWVGESLLASAPAGGVERLVGELTATGGRWAPEQARAASAALLTGLGYTSDDAWLFPFDAAGAAARLQATGGRLDKDTTRALAAAADPLRAADDVLALVPEPNAHLVGQVLGAVLGRQDAPLAGLDERVADWIRNYAGRAGEVDPDRVTGWWAGMIDQADRLAPATPAERAVLVETGLAVLIGEFGARPRTIVSVPSATLRRRLGELAGGDLGPYTAALIAELIPLWEHERQLSHEYESQLSDALATSMPAPAQVEAPSHTSGQVEAPSHTSGQAAVPAMVTAPGAGRRAGKVYGRLGALVSRGGRLARERPLLPLAAVGVIVLVAVLIAAVAGVGSGGGGGGGSPQRSGQNELTAPHRVAVDSYTYDGATVSLRLSNVPAMSGLSTVVLVDQVVGGQRTDAVRGSVRAADAPGAYTVTANFTHTHLDSTARVWVLTAQADRSLYATTGDAGATIDRLDKAPLVTLQQR